MNTQINLFSLKFKIKLYFIYIINNLAHWYSDCAAASKPAETGLIPV